MGSGIIASSSWAVRSNLFAKFKGEAVTGWGNLYLIGVRGILFHGVEQPKIMHGRGTYVF